jgi:lysophospholipase L1-like esterase
MYWYEEDVQQVEQGLAKLTYTPQMAFYGSSSIRLWDSLYDDFSQYKPVNLGFGGSTLEACSFFFERIFRPYHPQQLIIYAGDNDLGDGRQPAEVLSFFEQLAGQIDAAFPHTQVFYVSIKPSVARWDIVDEIQETNRLIASAINNRGGLWQYITIYNLMLNEDGKPNTSLYAEDGLHLNSKGYHVWKQALLQHFQLNIDSKIISHS